MPPLHTAYASQAKGQILVPPLNFALILPGPFRRAPTPQLEADLALDCRRLSFWPSKRQELSLHGYSRAEEHHVGLVLELLATLRADPTSTSSSFRQVPL